MPKEFHEWPKWMVNAHGERKSFPSQEAADADGKWYDIGKHPLDHDANGDLGGSAKPRRTYKRKAR